MGRPRPGARHRRPGGPARGLGTAPAPALQGTAPGTRNTRDPRRRRALEPLGHPTDRREPPGAVPPRPRFEPELTLRAARAARPLPGCRRHERDHPLSGGPRDTRLPGLPAVGPALSSDRAPRGLGARSGGRGRGAAGRPSPRAGDRRGRAEPADHRALARGLPGIHGRDPRPPRGPCPQCRRPWLRRGRKRALRPHRAIAPRRRRRLGRRTAGLERELPLYGRGLGCLSAPPHTRRHPRHHALRDAPAPRRAQALRHGRLGPARPKASGSRRGGSPGYGDSRPTPCSSATAPSRPKTGPASGIFVEIARSTSPSSRTHPRPRATVTTAWGSPISSRARRRSSGRGDRTSSGVTSSTSLRRPTIGRSSSSSSDGLCCARPWRCAARGACPCSSSATP